MSVYSSKCDIYDSLVEIHQYTDAELANNVKIYQYGNDKPLPIKCQKDLIPYYPFTIGSGSFNNQERTACINIGNMSYVDKKEKERLETYLKNVLRVYKHCKRKKINFDKQKALKEAGAFDIHHDQDVVREIVNRVDKHGYKATINGLHLYISDCYRKQLVNEMLANGIDPCKWGYDRFIKEKENESIKR